MPRVIASVGFRAALRADANRRLAKAANAAFVKLFENLDQSGSGTQYPGLPRRSSAEGEYPAPQSRTLQDSADAREVEPLNWQVGVFDPPEYAQNLEFGPEDGSSKGQRRFLSRTMEDPATIQAMNDAAEQG